MVMELPTGLDITEFNELVKLFKIKIYLSK